MTKGSKILATQPPVVPPSSGEAPDRPSVPHPLSESGSGSKKEPSGHGGKNSAFGFVLETVKIVIIALAIIIPVRYFLIQPFFVRGESMEPTLDDGDYLIIDQISYDLNEPKRGDIIIFKPPQDTSQFYIKRIIGLPGETVTIADNQVSISTEDDPEGYVLDETTYLGSDGRTPGDKITRLGDGEYFVMGDNRTRSSDSRTFGGIDEGLIVGKAWIRAFPFNSAQAFHEQSY